MLSQAVQLLAPEGPFPSGGLLTVQGGQLVHGSGKLALLVWVGRGGSYLIQDSVVFATHNPTPGGPGDLRLGMGIGEKRSKGRRVE